MSQVLNRIRNRLEAFDKSAVGYGAKLRLDLAEIIWRNLQQKKWSQRRLAKEARLADSIISNLIHGNKNCTFDTAGKVIHALGTYVTLQETTPSAELLSDGTFRFHGVSGEPVPILIEVKRSGETSTYEIKASAGS